MSRLGGIAALLCVPATLIGVWFFFHERDYAAKHDSELAGTLQWVGIAIALIGAAGFLLGLAIGYQDDKT